MVCAYILTIHVLSVWPTIVKCNEFCNPKDFIYQKKDGRVVLNGSVHWNRELHRRRDSKGKCFLYILVAGGGAGGANVSWTEKI